MIRFNKIAAFLAIVPVLALAGPALAANNGQIGGGDIYRIKNVTKNVDFIDPANADACDLLQYKVRIHNPGPASLTNVFVQASFPGNVDTSNTSFITASAIDASPSSTTDTATVNLSSAQSLDYVNGTTQLLDANGNVISNLPDGITQGGVSIGNVDVSTNNRRYVQFEERVSCPVTPTPTPTPTTQTVKSPVVAASAKGLPNTGPGDVAELFVGTSALGTAGHYLVTRRRR